MFIPSQKSLFDIPDHVAYLNNAYMSPLMFCVVEAMQKGMQTKVHPWTYSSQDFFTYADEARGLAGQIWGGPAENIAIVPSASYGLQIAANALPVSEGQEIVVLADQFPSNIYPWQERAANVGAKVNILPVPSDDDWTSVVLDAINADTAIVAIPEVHWSSGIVLDLLKIRKSLDNVGAALVLDLTQSLGAYPFNAREMRPDFTVAATYKWLMGPYSLGFLYVDPKWHEARPLENNWMNRLGSEDFTGLTRYRDAFQPGAQRFDMGEKSNAGQLMGASAAMRQILDWGIDNIAETLAAKTNKIAEGLVSHKITPIDKSKRAPHYLGLRFKGGVPEGLTERLSKEDIYVSVRGPLMRVTPHLYCNDGDIERFLEVMRQVV